MKAPHGFVLGLCCRILDGEGNQSGYPSFQLVVCEWEGEVEYLVNMLGGRE